jgi:hypothetical protein
MAEQRWRLCGPACANVTRAALGGIHDLLCDTGLGEIRRHPLLALEALARLQPGIFKAEASQGDQVHGFALLRDLNDTFESRTLRIQSPRHAAASVARAA